MSYRAIVVVLFLAAVIAQTAPLAQTALMYDVVYVRAPRYGDTTNTKWPDVFDPYRTEPNADLMLLHPDGTECVLVAGGATGAVIDPCVSFDGEWV